MPADTPARGRGSLPAGLVSRIILVDIKSGGLKE
jgi:hypothetical protein